jgi:hypothetical protein
MLVDTDVLIWHLRGYPQATRRWPVRWRRARRSIALQRRRR